MVAKKYIKPQVKRKKTKILRDASRVITRLHIPDDSSCRIPKIIDRVAGLTEKAAKELVDKIHLEFFDRHKDIKRVFDRHFRKATKYIPKPKQLSEAKKTLLGAYFTMEYSIESAALFNPSIVPHPNQTHVSKDSLRFIMSLRATGEGHISSIVFRSGIIDDMNSIIFDPIVEFVGTPDVQRNPVYDRHLFQLKLNEMNACNEITTHVLEQLPDEFSHNEFKDVLDHLRSNPDFTGTSETIETMHWLANSNYEVTFRADHRISERVIFPASENESSGIEDARFVQFFDDNGDVTYYATYTAFNGFNVLPQLIETKDFITFKIITLNGQAVQDKGMALFPRRVNGRCAMISRVDGENLFIMYSDNIHFFNVVNLFIIEVNTYL